MTLLKIASSITFTNFALAVGLYIYREYIAFCNYKGKRHAMLLKRRKAEFELLYIK